MNEYSVFYLLKILPGSGRARYYTAFTFLGISTLFPTFFQYTVEALESGSHPSSLFGSVFFSIGTIGTEERLHVRVIFSLAAGQKLRTMSSWGSNNTLFLVGERRTSTWNTHLTDDPPSDIYQEKGTTYSTCQHSLQSTTQRLPSDYTIAGH